MTNSYRQPITLALVIKMQQEKQIGKENSLVECIMPPMKCRHFHSVLSDCTVTVHVQPEKFTAQHGNKER